MRRLNLAGVVMLFGLCGSVYARVWRFRTFQ